MSDTSKDTTPQGAHDHHGVGHVVPFQLLVGVLVALLFLTVVTVAVSRVDLGFLNIWVAMGVATVKAVLVCGYFMHLRWDKPFNSIVLLSALAATGLFLGISMMDTREYQPHTYRIEAGQGFTSTSKDGSTGEQYLDKLADPALQRKAAHATDKSKEH